MFEWLFKSILITDPITASIIFLAMTSSMTLIQRRVIAWRTWKAVVAINMFSFVFGDVWLSTLGLSQSALLLGGGLLLIKCGLDILHDSGAADKDSSNLCSTQDIAIVPLATPLIAGPADIIIHIDAKLHYSLEILCAVILLQCFIYLALRVTAELGNLFSESFSKVYSVIGGLITLMVGVQFILDGITSFIAK